MRLIKVKKNKNPWFLKRTNQKDISPDEYLRFLSEIMKILSPERKKKKITIRIAKI
ncbi:hypothetical protein KAW18_05970 [candidate division WOR-3 bacterium]|nr:hypothetical protein [candidate division WOR-3 bacterium]MCK4526898.1 hypothetical protein [candidate division WOR-3 bacterium]